MILWAFCLWINASNLAQAEDPSGIRGPYPALEVRDGAQTAGAVDRGWYAVDGFHIPDNPNYVTGKFLTLEYRSFFVFDFAGSGGNLHSAASLRLFNPQFGLDIPVMQRALELYDVTTDVATIVNGAGGTAAFDDFGTGVLLGSVEVSAADANSIVEIELNAQGLDLLNTAFQKGDLFVIGARLRDVTADTDHIFAFTNDGTEITVLVLVEGVPTLRSWALILLFLGLVGFALRLNRSAREVD